jgi:CRISP-associated protein Cas1
MLRRSFYFVPEPGIALQVHNGALICRDREGRKQTFEPRIHGIHIIILAGHGSSITSEAVRWIGQEGVALYLMERSGECSVLFTDALDARGRRQALILRQRQWRVFLDPHKRLDVARKIVRAKLATLGLHPADAHEFRNWIDNADGLPDLLAAEAHAGAAYWIRWRGTKLHFQGNVPDHWHVFVTRSGVPLIGRIGTSQARNAMSPIGAMLNYSFAVALGQCVRACTGIGLDVHIGFLHVPRQGRLSFAYDVLELHRATLTQAVFTYATKRSFRRADFEMDRGLVRLGLDVAHDVAWLSCDRVPMAELARTVRRIVTWF